MASAGASAGRRRHGVGAGLWLALGSSLVGLASLEAAARLFLPRAGLQSSAAQLRGERGRLLLDAYPSNPRGYFDLDLREAGVRSRFPTLPSSRLETVVPRCPWAVATRYNSHQFRDAEPTSALPGVLRAVVVGDSFVEGQGVKAADTLPAQLQARLDRLEPGRWDVRNAGRRGADFPELNAVFHEALDAYAPDVVVYAWVLNDTERSPAFEARHSYVNDWIMLRMKPAARGPAWDSRLLGFARSRLEAERLGRESIRWYREMYGPNNRDGWGRTRDDVVALRDGVRQRGARLLVAIWPLLVDLDGEYPFTAQHAEIAAFLGAAGIPSLDLLPVLRGTETSSLWVHPVDHHPNEVAQAAAAGAVAPALVHLE